MQSAQLIAERIKCLCDKINVSINKMLVESGAGARTYHNMLAGSYPSVDKIVKIANYCGCTVDYLLGVKNISCPIPDIASTQNYVVGYIDFLGIKSMINNNHLQTAMDNLTDVYSLIIKAINAANTDEQIIQVKTFSDNALFCISHDINEGLDDYYAAVLCITKCIAYVQLDALRRKNLILRGGICEGRLSINNTFVLGEALIDAYGIENEEAIYPRVVISDSIIKKIENRRIEWIDIDSDNRHYINFLMPIKTLFDNEKESFVNTLANNLRNNFENLHDPHIMSKYIWIYEKLYDFCEKQNMTKSLNSIIPSPLFENCKKICRNSNSGNVKNSSGNSVAVGNNNSQFSINNGSVAPISTQEQDLLRIYNNASTRQQIKLMDYALAIEDEINCM